MSIIACLGLAACADKTSDQWRAEEAERKAAEIRAISGIYRGNLVSKIDGAVISPVEIELLPETTVGNSQDQLGSEQKTTLQGRVTVFYGTATQPLHFNGGYFGPNPKSPSNGKVTASSSVTMKNKEKVDFDIDANITGSVLKGSLSVAGYIEMGASFELEKNGPLPASDSLIGGKPGEASPGVPAGIEEYLGSISSGNANIVKMSILNLPPSVEEELVYRFYPKRVVDISIDQGSAGRGYFPSVVMDLRSGTFSAQGTYAANAAANLACRKTGTQEWTCTLLVNGVLNYSLVKFVPASAADQEVFRGSLVKRDGETVAAMEVVLQHKNLENLQVQVTLKDRKEKVWNFSDVIYSPSDGLLFMYKTVKLSTGDRLEITMDTRLSDKKMTGVMTAVGSNGSRITETLGHFELEMDAAFPVVEPPLGKPEFSAGAKEFVGEVTLAGSKTPTSVKFKYEITSSSAEEAFLDGVYPIRAAEIDMELGNIKYEFPGSRVDTTSGTITGASGFGARANALQCRTKEVASGIQGWDCLLASAQSETLRLILKPKAESPAGAR
ncbi:MAG TPA: hypothetical protein DCS07_15200 [Bdellovibrionales bacterium]|nr:MAG: hypothetical protein A2X97_06430 [Bdellovibrionales bacterium GWA1_52_35]OFZ43532.1 MAG: hypothetical protein A2070_00235 [Bdellovibrionales bacterium GWC1_52_8]HAR43957.1 hypothetical protein [Bdellovibrionales bacterium]HCM40873.1 hypothetical protein [Bdellovibrionales bacterium]